MVPRPQAAGGAQGSILPSMDGLVSVTEAKQAMDTQGSTPCLWLSLLSPAGCEALLKLQLPSLSCTNLLPKGGHWGIGKSSRVSPAQVPRRNESN